MQTYLLARSNVPHFSTKEDSVIILKMTDFWRKNLTIINNVKKYKFSFPYNTFVSYTLQKNWSFPLRIFSVNVTQTVVSCGLGHLLKKSLIENFIFCVVIFVNKNFFSRIYRDGIRDIFHNIWMIFGRKYSNSNF